MINAIKFSIGEIEASDQYLDHTGNFVPDPFADQFTLKLGERQQDIQRQPSHARGGVELLGD